MQRIPVALSLGQSNNPVKRELEKDIVSQLANDARFDVIVISNLYDLKPKGEGVTALQPSSQDGPGGIDQHGQAGLRVGAAA